MSDFYNKAVNNTLSYDERRALAKDYLPASISGGSLSIIGFSDSSYNSISLPNNSTMNISFTNTLDTEEEPLDLIDVVIYASGVIVPSASSGRWKLFGPVYCSWDRVGTPATAKQQIARLSLSNLSGSNHTVVVSSRWRSIINSGGGAEEAV